MLKREGIETKLQQLENQLQKHEKSSIEAGKIKQQIEQLRSILCFEEFDEPSPVSYQNTYWCYYQRLHQKAIIALQYRYLVEVEFAQGEPSQLRQRFQRKLAYTRHRLSHHLVEKKQGIELVEDPFLAALFQQYHKIEKADLPTALGIFIKKELPFLRKVHMDIQRSRPELPYDKKVLQEAIPSNTIQRLAEYDAYHLFRLPLKSEAINEAVKEAVKKEKENASNYPKMQFEGYTLAQQYYVIYYLLICLNMDFGVVAKTDIARFVRLLTNRELGKPIAKGNIYKRVKRPFTKKDAKMVQDLQKILPFFESLRLVKATKMIQKDIKSYKN